MGPLRFDLALAVAALAVEAAAGYPEGIFRRIGHPVTWIGAGITALERGLNRPACTSARRRGAGILALAILLAGVAFVTAPIQAFAHGLVGFAVLVLVSASLPAQRSLATHVRAVADALESGGLTAGRAAVAMIVGRNPAFLDASGVCSAAVESLAENFSDGIVAPAFWLAAGGLPGGALYKAANTADSMIGHKTERYAAFGWAAARFDDLVNLPASRLAALWLVLAAVVTRNDWQSAVRAIRRDARHHRSPNAGWPEAAMAGALGLRIGGPRVYGETTAPEPFMGQGRSAITPADMRRALRLYRVACMIQGAVLLALVVLLG